jgi:starch synthase
LLKVLFIASEGAPFIKTGGLGEVCGSLPVALHQQGIDARLILPKYKAIPRDLREKIRHKKYIFVKLGWRNQYCGIEESEYNGVPVYFIDNEYYFGRDGVYGYGDDEVERYVFFCRAVLDSLPHIGWAPHVVHCHDWQTAAIPVLLEAHYRHLDYYRDIGTLMTIHNLKYQGIFSKSILGDLLDLGDEYFFPDKLEFYGNVNLMKGGLVYANLINTVSPTYATEIQMPFFGEKLDGLLRARKHDLFGILNGVDYGVYNPATDPLIFKNYDAESLEGKKENKLKLQESLGLDIREDVPLLSIILRLVPQKGVDLIAHVLEEILMQDIQLVVLGTGEWHYENMFRDAAWRYPRKVSANIFYDNTLAHRIYAGADIFLMPSLFEPCGLAQLFSMKYGTLPIVRETGGLKDTVQSFNEFTGEGNGFSFTNCNAHDMLYTIKRALGFYYQKDIWNSLVKRAMQCDYSWDRSAEKYITLYHRLN